jgi:hypothetical protein
MSVLLVKVEVEEVAEVAGEVEGDGEEEDEKRAGVLLMELR